MGVEMRQAATSKADEQDDAFMSRAAQAGGFVMSFDEAVEVEGGTKVAVSIRSEMILPADMTIAHGRRLVLAALVG